MKIISFAWTTPALLAGAKTVTRRDWKEPFARRFVAGEYVSAYDRQPRFRGKEVAIIRLTEAPHLEPLKDIPASDWYNEGFDWLSKHAPDAKIDGLSPKALWRVWRNSDRQMWVVRFELERVFGQSLDTLGSTNG